MSEKRDNILREMVREEFEAWRDEKQRIIEATDRTEYNRFVNAWAMRAYLADYERDRRGHEVEKLQKRIHRQRVANKEMVERVAELERELASVKSRVLDMRDYCPHEVEVAMTERDAYTEDHARDPVYRQAVEDDWQREGWK